MPAVPTIDTLFPLLLKEWKESWVRATNAPGELKCKVEQSWGDGYETEDALIAAMDASGVQTILATDLLAWSYTRQERFALDMGPTIASLTRRFPGRVYGLADYDPLHIRQSLDRVERDVREHGYKGVYLHVYGYDIGLDHRKMYPLYALCEGLGIVVTMQIGHVLEAMPSEHGRPMQLDRIACDFPDLKLVGTHTGYPWVDEAVAVATKWPNVFLSTSAWLPRYLHPSFLTFLKSRTGAEKAMFGTNGLHWGRYLADFDQLGLPPERAEAILAGNARRVFGI